MENEKKKVILSGIQPTGTFTLGNYLGAVINWEKLQDEYTCYYMIANLHALTVYQEPADLRRRTLESYALLMACGIDPDKSLLFIQSDVPTHPELSWILSCCTGYGELGRMTQFKDKSAKHADNVNAGLYTYPVLMAADILAYNPDLVPVGADQTQHLELTRNVATRFNQRYGELFKLPEGYVPKAGARIMSLADPTRKMSKSDENKNATVLILDDKDTIIRKFKRAVTDSDSEIVYKDGKDGINNLITIYSAVTGKTIKEVEAEFDGKGYGEFKTAVGEAVADSLKSVRENYTRYIADKKYLRAKSLEHAEKALKISGKIVSKAYHKVGLLDR